MVVEQEMLERRLGFAILGEGGALSADAVLRTACDARLSTVVVDPLGVSSSKRKVPKRLIRALRVRDGGCVWCGASYGYCEAHHLVHWENGGRTVLANLALVRRTCDRRFH